MKWMTQIIFVTKAETGLDWPLIKLGWRSFPIDQERERDVAIQTLNISHL